MDQDFARTMTVEADVPTTYRAIGTVQGVRRWWTPVVAGIAEPDGVIAVGFCGLEEAILLRVDEADGARRVAWTCLRHTSSPEWTGSRITFDLSAAPGGRCALSLRHTGVDRALVEPGWEAFLGSLERLLKTGVGSPYDGASARALQVARDYHQAWTAGDHARARALLADDLVADVPINVYAGADDFAAAVQRFGGSAERVDLLAEFGGEDTAMLVYDLHIPALGALRVAEQFTVAGGVITRIRHVHDTAPLRDAAA
jgi:SnoaL-like domain